MPDPLPSRAAPPHAPTLGRRRRAGRAVLAGLCILAVSLLLILSPLLFGRWSLNRFFVAFGILGACLGSGCLLNGAWDWLRGRE